MLQICYQNEDPNDLRLDTYLRYTLVLKPAFKALEKAFSASGPVHVLKRIN